ncbi:hypothetical protein M1B72_14335 [Geomonas paludis]|uniref:Uncharacterized protein n=1 Tax=Geomonas paludis TaxID=2740185 RepID=A0ABY4L9F7_9BACT|nr:hypothetical protein [Geomonas paludis]UPU34622.1 hypothetical protein M1B72_14335 [Geomonas paludis]
MNGGWPDRRASFQSFEQQFPLSAPAVFSEAKNPKKQGSTGAVGAAFPLQVVD